MLNGCVHTAVRLQLVWNCHFMLGYHAEASRIQRISNWHLLNAYLFQHVVLVNSCQLASVRFVLTCSYRPHPQSISRVCTFVNSQAGGPRKNWGLVWPCGPARPMRLPAEVSDTRKKRWVEWKGGNKACKTCKKLTGFFRDHQEAWKQWPYSTCKICRITAGVTPLLFCWPWPSGSKRLGFNRPDIWDTCGPYLHGAEREPVYRQRLHAGLRMHAFHYPTHQMKMK